MEEADGEESGEAFVEFIARLAAADSMPTNAPKGVKQTLRRVKFHGASDTASADFRERSRSGQTFSMLHCCIFFAFLYPASQPSTPIRFKQEDGKWMYVYG